MAGETALLRKLCRLMPKSQVVAMCEAMQVHDYEQEILLQMCGNEQTIETLANTEHVTQYRRRCAELRNKVASFIADNGRHGFFPPEFIVTAFLTVLDKK